MLGAVEAGPGTVAGMVQMVFLAQGDADAPCGTSTGSRMTRQAVRQRRVAVGAMGLEASVEYHRRPTTVGTIMDPGERALLAQAVEHYRELATAFPGADLLASAARDGAAPTAGVGENLLVCGLTCDNVCMGDVFGCRGVDGQLRSLQLEVTGPRRPCCDIDLKHGAGFGGRGVRQRCAETGK